MHIVCQNLKSSCSFENVSKLEFRLKIQNKLIGFVDFRYFWKLYKKVFASRYNVATRLHSFQKGPFIVNDPIRITARDKRLSLRNEHKCDSTDQAGE